MDACRDRRGQGRDRHGQRARRSGRRRPWIGRRPHVGPAGCTRCDRGRDNECRRPAAAFGQHKWSSGRLRAVARRVGRCPALKRGWCGRLLRRRPRRRWQFSRRGLSDRARRRGAGGFCLRRDLRPGLRRDRRRTRSRGGRRRVDHRLRRRHRRLGSSRNGFRAGRKVRRVGGCGGRSGGGRRGIRYGSGRRRLRGDGGACECRRQRGRGRVPRRQDRLRVDVAILIVRAADPEVDVRNGKLGRPARADRSDDVTFDDAGSHVERERAEVREGDRLAVGGAYAQRLAVCRCRAGERHDTVGRRAHRVTRTGADIDAAMLAAGIRVGRVKNERLQDRPGHRPHPGRRWSW